MTSQCPLCISNNVREIDSFSAKKIKQFYTQNFEFSVDLKNDGFHYYECQHCFLRFFTPPETGSESFYEQLQKQSFYYMDDKPEYKIAQQWIEKDMSILEVGAGKAAFAQYVKKANYTGLEFNEGAIAKAKKSSINLVKQSIEEHAQQKNKYDVVVSFQVLEHIARPRSFLQSCLDCLKPDGKMIIAVPSQDGFLGLASNSFLDMPPHHVTRWSARTLRKLEDVFGLACLDIKNEPVAPFHHRLARTTLAAALVKRKLGLKNRVVEDRFGVLLLEKISMKLGLLLSIDISHLKGHTVLALYEKTK